MLSIFYEFYFVLNNIMHYVSEKKYLPTSSHILSTFFKQLKQIIFKTFETMNLFKFNTFIEIRYKYNLPSIYL